MNNLTKEINQYIFDTLKKGLTLEVIADNIIRDSEEFLEGTFDLSSVRDEMQFIIMLSKAQDPKDDLEKEEAFTNTINEYKEIDTDYIRNELKEFSKFDKVIIQDGKPYLAKLTTLLSITFSHINMIKAYQEIKENSKNKELSLILSKCEKNEELINPKINTLNTAHKITNSNDVLDSVNIFKKFKENPIETDMVLNLISGFPDEHIDHDLLNTNAFRSARDILECNHIGFDEDKIMESLAIYIFAIYQKDSYLNKLLQLGKELSRSKVVKITNTLLPYIFKDFEDKDFTYRHTHVVKPMQQYSTFLDFKDPLLEFRNKKNKQEHPFLEKDVDEELLSFYKSK